ncbi:unnamed protein product [Lymnaea stagnalis]|uniref:Uncharacterized protein n=1 Tax=Lymnaea stagnalis TaxID=6523 RepID=A0AAV2HAV1_LYMST
MPSTLPVLDSHSSEYADGDSSSYSEDTAPNVTLAFIGCPSSHTEISLDFETPDPIRAHSSSEVFHEHEQRRKPGQEQRENVGSTEKEVPVAGGAPLLEMLNDTDTDIALLENIAAHDADTPLRSGPEAWSAEKCVTSEDLNVMKDPQKINGARQPLYNPLERGDAPCRLCTPGRTSPIPLVNDGKKGGRSPRKMSGHSKRNPSVSPCDAWQRKRSNERSGEGKTSQKVRGGVRVHKSQTEGRHADDAGAGPMNFPTVDQVRVARAPKKPPPGTRAKAQGDMEPSDKEIGGLAERQNDSIDVDLTHAGDMDTDMAVAAASKPNPPPGTKQQSRGHPNIDKMFKDVLRILIEQSGPKSESGVTSIYDDPADSKPFSFKSTGICSFGFQAETSKSNNACALSDAVVSDEGSDGTDTDEPASEMCETSTCFWPQSQSHRCDTDPNRVAQEHDDIVRHNKNCHHCFDDEEEWEKSDPQPPSDSDSCEVTDDGEDSRQEDVAQPSRENLEICRRAVQLKAENFQERVSAIAESSRSNTIREKSLAGLQGGEGEMDGETDIVEDAHRNANRDPSSRALIKQRPVAPERVTLSRYRKDKCLKSSNLENAHNNCENYLSTNTSIKLEGQSKVNPGTFIGSGPGEVSSLRDTSVGTTKSQRQRIGPTENLSEDNIEIIVTPPSPKYPTPVTDSEVTDSLKDGPSNLKVPLESYAPLTKRPKRLSVDDQEQEDIELTLDNTSEETSLLKALTDANDSKSYAESPPFTEGQSRQGILSACLEKARAVIKKVRARSVSPVKLFSKLNRFLSKDKEDVPPMKSLSELYDAGESHEPCRLIIHKSRLVEFQAITTRTHREGRARVEESSPSTDQQQPGDAHPPIFCLSVRNSSGVKMSTMRIPRYDPFRTPKRTSIGEDTRLRNPCSPALQGHRPIPVQGRVLESNALSCAVRGTLLAPANNDSDRLQASNAEMEFQEYNHRRSAFRQYRENNGSPCPQSVVLAVDPRETTSGKFESDPTECIVKTATRSEAAVTRQDFGHVEAAAVNTREQQCVVIEGNEAEWNLIVQGSLSWSDLRENEEVSTHEDVSSSAPIKTHSLLNVSETAHTESCVNDVMAIISQEVNIKRYPSFPDLTDLNDDDPGSAAGRELAASSSPLPDIEFENDATLPGLIDSDTSPLHIKTEQSPISAAEVEMLKISQRRREASDKLSEEEGYEKLTPPNSPHLGAPSSGVQVQTMVSLLESCSMLCGETDAAPSRNSSTVNATPHAHPEKLSKVVCSTLDVQRAVAVVNQPSLESEPTSFTSSSANEQEMKLMHLPSPPSSSPSHSSCSQRDVSTERAQADLMYAESTSKAVAQHHVAPYSCAANLEGLRAALTLDYNILADETSSACGNVNTLSEQRVLLDESDVSQLSQFVSSSEAIPKVHSGTSIQGLVSLGAAVELTSADIGTRASFEAMPTIDTKSLAVPNETVAASGGEAIGQPTSAILLKVKTCTVQNDCIFKKTESPADSYEELILEEEDSLSSSGKTSSPKYRVHQGENSTKDTHLSSSEDVYWQEDARLKLRGDFDRYPVMAQGARSQSAERPREHGPSEAARSPILSTGENQRTPLRRIKWSTHAYAEDESEQLSQSSSFSDRSEEFGISETTLKETKRDASLLESLSEHHPIVPTCEVNGPPIQANPRVVKIKNKTKRSTSMIDKSTKKKPANKSNLNNNVSMLSVFGLVPLRKIISGKRNRSPMSKTNQAPVVVPDGVNLDPKSDMMKISYVITPVSQIIGVSYADEKSAGSEAFDLESESKDYQLDVILPRALEGAENEGNCLDELELEKTRKDAVKSKPCLYLLPQKAGTFTSDPRKSNTKKSLEVQEIKTKPANAKDKPAINRVGEIVAPPRVTRKIIATHDTYSAQRDSAKNESPKSVKGSPEFSFSQPVACSPRQHCLTTSYSLPLVVKKGSNPVYHQQPRLGHGVRPSRTMTTLNRLSERIQRSELQAAKGYDFVERSHFHMERCEKLIRRSSEIIKKSQLMVSSSKKRMEDTAKIMNLNCKRYFLC